MSIKSKLKILRNYIQVLPLVGVQQATTFLRYPVSRQSKELRSLTLKKSGYTVFLRNGSTVDRDVFRYVFHNRFHRSPIELASQPIILDLGANIGLSAVELKLTHPDARIFAVEMDEENFTLACQNTANLKEVEVINRAVWFEKQVMKYSKSGDEDAYQLKENPQVNSDNNNSMVSVETIDINSIIDILDSPLVDYVKLDIEGAEKEVLTRNNSWIGKIGCINAEIHDPTFLEPSMEILRGFGLDVWKDKNHWSAIIGVRPDYKTWRVAASKAKRQK